MSIIVAKITGDQRYKVLSIDEGHFHDLKSRRIKPSRLTRPISAFANASGGELYIGVEEEEIDGHKIRHWRGFPDPEAANAHLQVFEQLFPLGRYFSYMFLECNGEPGLVLQVGINKTRDITKASDGIPYLRRGAQNLPVKTPEALQRLKFDKGITSFETELLEVAPALITNSEIIIKFILEVIPTVEPEEWLAKQMLLLDGKPTVGGVLLFGEQPQAILPKRSAIKVYRYKSTDSEGTRETLAFDLYQ